MLHPITQQSGCCTPSPSKVHKFHDINDKCVNLASVFTDLTYYKTSCINCLNSYENVLHSIENYENDDDENELKNARIY